MSDLTRPADPFSNIVAVCDLDDDGPGSIRRAAVLGRAHGAQMTVLAVRDSAADIRQLARFAGVGTQSIAQGMIDDMRAALASLVAPFKNGMEIGIEARIGRPFREIIGDVLDHDRDLVIKMAEPFDGTHSYLFTSTDQHLIRKCPCPVWLAMPGAAPAPKTMLAAVDLEDDDDDQGNALNREIIALALRVAMANGARLHVTHVWEAPAEDLIRRWTNDADDVERYLDTIETRRRAALDRLVGEVLAELDAEGELPAIVPHLARGRPRDVIPAHIHSMGVDLLVIGTLARTGVPGLIIGNTAEDVLNAVDCSVLTVKPPGYVSPLALG